MAHRFFAESVFIMQNENEYEAALKEELQTVKEQVRFLLENYPSTRNSDFYLAILWLKYFSTIDAFKKIWVEWDDIRQYEGKIETISRVRRKFQERGEYMPTDPSVYEKRQKKREAMRKVINQI